MSLNNRWVNCISAEPIKAGQAVKEVGPQTVAVLRAGDSPTLFYGFAYAAVGAAGVQLPVVTEPGQRITMLNDGAFPVTVPSDLSPSDRIDGAVTPTRADAATYRVGQAENIANATVNAQILALFVEPGGAIGTLPPTVCKPVVIYVDPDNTTGVASDTNPGTLAAPVLTWEGLAGLLPADVCDVCHVEVLNNGVSPANILSQIGFAMLYGPHGFGWHCAPLVFHSKPINLQLMTATGGDTLDVIDAALAMAPDQYKRLHIECLTGANAGSRRMVRTNDATTVRVNNAWLSPVAPGDTFQLQLEGAYIATGVFNAFHTAFQLNGVGIKVNFCFTSDCKIGTVCSAFLGSEEGAAWIDFESEIDHSGNNLEDWVYDPQYYFQGEPDRGDGMRRENAFMLRGIQSDEQGFVMDYNVSYNVNTNSSAQLYNYVGEAIGFLIDELSSLEFPQFDSQIPLLDGGNGIIATRKSTVTVDNCEIKNQFADAVLLDGTSYCSALGTIGAGNGGVGVACQGMSQASYVQGGTTVTGAGGDWRTGGDVGTWAALPAFGHSEMYECDCCCDTHCSDDVTVQQQSIPVDDTSKYKAAGFIRIGDEVIQYAAKSLQSFDQCTRGASGTVATTHKKGDDCHHDDGNGNDESCCCCPTLNRVSPLGV